MGKYNYMIAEHVERLCFGSIGYVAGISENQHIRPVFYGHLGLWFRDYDRSIKLHMFDHPILS